MSENVNVQSAALRRIEECRVQGVHIDVFQKTRVVDIIGEPEMSYGIDIKDQPTIHLNNGKKLKVCLLAMIFLNFTFTYISTQVGADGINSPVHDFAKIKSSGWNYDSQGVVATLKLNPEQSDCMATILADRAYCHASGKIYMISMLESY